MRHSSFFVGGVTLMPIDLANWRTYCARSPRQFPDDISRILLCCGLRERDLLRERPPLNCMCCESERCRDGEIDRDRDRRRLTGDFLRFCTTFGIVFVVEKNKKSFRVWKSKL